MAKIKAFVLDHEALGLDAAEGGDPYTFGIFPGLWVPGRPVSPAALGIEYSEMRELVDRLDLPLKEVTVEEKQVALTFPEDPNRMESGPLSQLGEFAEGEENLRPATEVVNVAGGPVALPPPAPKLNLQPATAVAIAEASAHYLGEDDAEAAEAAAEDPEAIAGATAEEAAKAEGS